MKQHARFLARQAAQLDPAAVRLFRLTLLLVTLCLLASLGLLAAGWLGDSLPVIRLADGLFHASFRMAAIGGAAAFGADIAAKAKQR